MALPDLGKTLGNMLDPANLFHKDAVAPAVTPAPVPPPVPGVATVVKQQTPQQRDLALAAAGAVDDDDDSPIGAPGKTKLGT